MAAHVVAFVIFAVLVIGALIGGKHREEIESLRQPKSHWKQGHKLTIGSKQNEKKGNSRRATTPLDEEDLEELDGMFGDAGTRPEDYA